jgi:Right handed beta helix region
VIRGEDRNEVILDGGDELYNGFQVAADGVAIENLTVQRFVVNGLVFTNQYDASNPGEGPVLKGYRASYVTVANNGLYGLYAFYAEGGQFDHVYGSGHPDGGIYIGQCKPCNAVVTDAIMERNGLGYSGTNASGGLFIVNSIFRRNRIGMSPNSQSMERLAPQGDVVIGGNLVADNDDPETPPAASGTFGYGIGVGGGERNIIVRNRVSGNDSVGIGITTLESFLPLGNRVEGNVLENNGTDLAFFASSGAELASAGNCFSGNTFTSSLPASIEQALPCGEGGQASIVASPVGLDKPAPAPFDYRKIPLPATQPTMPNALTAPVKPAVATIPTIDLSSLKVPS